MEHLELHDKLRVVTALRIQADKLLQVKTRRGWESQMERIEQLIEKNKLAPGEPEEDGWNGWR